MYPAMRFRLDDRGAPLAGNLGSQARTRDAATDDQDIEIHGHTGRLRFGKPCRLGLAP
jgi:hypothetical protein